MIDRNHRRQTTHAWVMALLLVTVQPGSVRSDEPSAPPPDVASGPAGEEAEPREPAGAQSVGKGSAQSETDAPPVYVPPPRGTTRSRVGAATRGIASESRPAALAPAHVGLTTRAAPVLYWGAPSDAAGVVRVVLAAEKSDTALLEIDAATNPSAGIYSIDLEQHGVSLEVGETYQWVTTLVRDPDRPWKDRETYAAVTRVAASAGLQRQLAANPKERAYRVYAENGVWFDAIQDLSAQIAEAPDDPNLRAARASLLEQVKRSDLARVDRASGLQRH